MPPGRSIGPSTETLSKAVAQGKRGRSNLPRVFKIMQYFADAGTFEQKLTSKDHPSMIGYPSNPHH